jgi:hypothetical protein
MAKKNTVLLIEPRIFDYLPNIIRNAQEILGDSWNYVFLCGKGKMGHWSNVFDFGTNKNAMDFGTVQIRELPVENFEEPRQFNDFLKSKSLWQSLEGDFVLTIQSDTWLMKDPKYTIDYFINMNKTFIGGNCNYRWNECIREDVIFEYPNFNGGLSLRKRQDLIKILDIFPPEPTGEYWYDSNKIETDAEDVYFVLCANKLGLEIGNTEECSHFAVHSYYVDGFFGIHNPYAEETKEFLKTNHPELMGLNPGLKLYTLADK